MDWWVHTAQRGNSPIYTTALVAGEAEDAGCACAIVKKEIRAVFIRQAHMIVVLFMVKATILRLRNSTMSSSGIMAGRSSIL